MAKKNYYVIKRVVVILLVLFTSCSASEPWVASEYENWESLSVPESSKKQFTLFLIGDTGAPQIPAPDPVFELLKYAIDIESGDRTVVFLGDNIYDDGFVPEPAEERKRSEQILAANLDIVNSPDVTGIFIPGNHDWWSNFAGMAEQERFINNFPGNKDHIHFSPRAGCPGPELWELHPAITLVTLDSQWFIDNAVRSYTEKSGCENITREGALQELNQISSKHEDKLLVLATHHPFYSRGEHGGKYTWKQHIFPGTDLHPALWIPLPVVGSLYPLIRNRGVGNQDFSATANKKYRFDVLEQVKKHPLFISAAGHDHNLQYFSVDGMHQIVSGSGSKRGYAVKGGDAGFLLDGYGFSILNLYDDGEIWIEFWTTQVSKEENPVFRYPIERLKN